MMLTVMGSDGKYPMVLMNLGYPVYPCLQRPALESQGFWVGRVCGLRIPRARILGTALNKGGSLLGAERWVGLAGLP